MKAYHWKPLLEEAAFTSCADTRSPCTMQPQCAAEKRCLRPATKVATPAVAKAAAPAAKVKVRRGPPVCVECAMHSVRFEWISGKTTHRCHDPMTRDPVTGAPTDPMLNRRSAISCGPQGSYWQAKPPRPERQVERDVDDSEPDDYVPPVPFIRLAHRPPDDCIAVLWQPGMEIAEP